jgi:hypothetical protein
VLGSSGLPREAELWIMQIEDALRRAEPRIRRDLPGLVSPLPGRRYRPGRDGPAVTGPAVTG